MKRYTDEEILDYARSHVRHVDQTKGKKLVLAFFLVTGAFTIGWLISLILERSQKTGIKSIRRS